MPSNEDILLTAGGAAASLWAVGGLFAPKTLHKALYSGAPNAPPANPQQAQLFGAVVGSGITATNLALLDADTKTKKKLLKVQAGVWLLTGGLYAWNAHKGTQRKDTGYGVAALKVAVGTANLVQAFRKD